MKRGDQVDVYFPGVKDPSLGLLTSLNKDSTADVYVLDPPETYGRRDLKGIEKGSSPKVAPMFIEVGKTEKPAKAEPEKTEPEKTEDDKNKKPEDDPGKKSGDK